jgi:hypothetical protein
MLGKGKFLPPKLPLLLQHAASAPAPRIVYGKSSVSVQANPRRLGLEIDLLSTNCPSRLTN